MTDQTVIDIGGRAMWVAIQVAAPALITTLVVGLVVSIFQAATQIQEQTLTFIPKILIMTAVLVISGPWILEVMVNFTVELFNGIPGVTH